MPFRAVVHTDHIAVTIGLVIGGLVALGMPGVARAGLSPAANDCKRMPPFVQGLGMGAQPMLSTSERRFSGLVLLEHASGEGRTWRHDTWARAGRLGPMAIDGDGTVFVAPVPMVDVMANPPAEQNVIHRVDPTTGAMEPFLRVPEAAPPKPENPYGLLGLTYDCDTRSLYATTVMGSTRREERGRIVRIESATKAVHVELDGVDAMGLAVFRGPRGKKLYYGLARRSEVWSLRVDPSGALQGPAQLEFSIEGLGPRGDDRARRITLLPGPVLLVHGVMFGFNLAAPADRQQSTYRFRFEPASERWTLDATE